MFSTLDQYERLDLIQVTLPWIQHLGSKKRRTILREIARAFREWKMAEADDRGMVQIADKTLGGLLGQSLGHAERTHRQVPATKAKAWQCADVSDNLSLAFYLWLSKPNPFHEVLARYGHAEVFATLTYQLRYSAWSHSLIRASGFLSSLAHGQAMAWKEVAVEAYAKLGKPNDGLAKARAKSLVERPQQARMRHEYARQLAIDYRRQHLSASSSDVVAYLKGFNEFRAWKSERTFLQAIQGTLSEVLKSLDTKPHR